MTRYSTAVSLSSEILGEIEKLRGERSKSAFVEELLWVGIASTPSEEILDLKKESLTPTSARMEGTGNAHEVGEQ